MSSTAIDHHYRKFEHAGWERAAAAYADSFEAATKLFALPLLQAVGIRDGMQLLEVACGTGFVAATAAAHGAIVTGVDFSAGMLAEAKKRQPSLSLWEADAEKLPFPDSVFDAVVINFGVHHFSYPQHALAEAYRVLRAKGRVAFTVWACPEENAIQRILIDAVREAGDAAASIPYPPSGAVADIASCQLLLRQAGFDAATLRAEKVEAFLALESAQKLVDIFVDGAVQTSAILRSQPREKLPMILATVEKAVAPYRAAGQLRIPATAILASGARS